MHRKDFNDSRSQAFLPDSCPVKPHLYSPRYGTIRCFRFVSPTKYGLPSPAVATRSPWCGGVVKVGRLEPSTTACCLTSSQGHLSVRRDTTSLHLQVEYGSGIGLEGKRRLLIHGRYWRRRPRPSGRTSAPPGEGKPAAMEYPLFIRAKFHHLHHGPQT